MYVTKSAGVVVGGSSGNRERQSEFRSAWCFRNRAQNTQILTEDGPSEIGKTPDPSTW